MEFPVCPRVISMSAILKIVSPFGPIEYISAPNFYGYQTATPILGTTHMVLFGSISTLASTFYDSYQVDTTKDEKDQEQARVPQGFRGNSLQSCRPWDRD